jgi:hypothetical protein
MIRNTTARVASLALCLLAAASCASDPVDPEAGSPVLTLASPQVLRLTDGLRPVPDTLVFALRSPDGTPLSSMKVYTEGTTGWLRSVPDQSEWARPDVYRTDSVGQFRLLWLPSGSGPQRLVFSAEGPAALERTIALQRPAVPFRADSIVTSGADAVCVQSGGRVGCVGVGTCVSCRDASRTSTATGAVHWFRLSAPPRALSSTLSGACALMTDGTTACWNGLGPDSVATTDVGHPPFVEFTGSIGRTASGEVWKGVLSGPTGNALTYANRTWNRIPSDSVMAALLTDLDETFVCARTASNAVMCSLANNGPISPTVVMQPFRLLRSLPDSGVVRAAIGYTAVQYGTDGRVNSSVVVRTAGGAGLLFEAPVGTSAGWYAVPSVDETLAGADLRARNCLAVLDATCGGGPWRQVSIAGRMRTLFNGSENGYSGFRRTCGVRDVIVCHLRIQRAGGQGSRPYRYEAVDTVSLAP